MKQLFLLAAALVVAVLVWVGGLSIAARSLYMIEKGEGKTSPSTAGVTEQRQLDNNDLQQAEVTVADPTAATTNATTKNATGRTTTKWGCNSIPSDLQEFLDPHCKIQPDLPLSDLLPDLNYFRRIVEMLANANSTEDSVVLVAGRGGTANRTIANWFHSTRQYQHNKKIVIKQGFIHHNKAHCTASTSTTWHLMARLRKAAGHLNDQFPAIRQLGNQNFDSILHERYRKYLDAPLEYLEGALTYSHCSDYQMVFLDTPLVNMFTELYLALGPKTNVMLSRRDSHEWALHRASEHGKGFFCDGAWERIPDPFSYVQCSSTGTLPVELKEVNPEILSSAYNKYNSHVHNLVPGNCILDLNLFSYKTYNDTNDRAKWTELNQKLVYEFLN